jgi:hypothetical protein
VVEFGLEFCRSSHQLSAFSVSKGRVLTWHHFKARDTLGQLWLRIDATS